MNTIGENILQMRKEAGLTQEAAAEKIGVSRQTIAKWEAGESSPDLALAAKLASVLGVSLNRLAGTETQGGSGGKFVFGAVRLAERGQISIPKKCREVFDLRAGDYLVVLGDIDRGIALMKLTSDQFLIDAEEEED
ncbi:MAG: helix-turn-helix domain-containing protein [Clostridia bacterium]|nr:helix-turn-helix domain-containing protein [Clostridia bacterium]